MTFEISKSKNKKYIKKYMNNKTGYKVRNIIANILFIIIALVMCVPIAYYCFSGAYMHSGVADSEGIVIILFAEVAFALIIAIVAIALKNNAFRKGCAPYSTRENVQLKIYEDGIEYIYDETDIIRNPDRSDDAPAEIKVRYPSSYRIPRENIERISYNRENHLMTIVGNYEILTFSDKERKTIAHQRLFEYRYENPSYNSYSFFLALEDEGQEKEVLETINNIRKIEED